MQFKPVKGAVFYPGLNDENELARSILIDSRIRFSEWDSSHELSGFPNERPLLVVNGRQYYGLEKIKMASMSIFSK